MSLLKRKASAGPSNEPAAARALPPAAASAAPSSAHFHVPEMMWTDKHAPSSSADLAMHKKKVDEIRQWLRIADASLQLGLPPTPRMLVLSGPPGSGKSAMLRVLAKELDFEVCEWIEPRTQAWVAPADRIADEVIGQEYESRVAQFEGFLRSSLRTLSLCISGGPSSASRRRLVLLDEMAPAGGSDGTSPMHRQQVWNQPAT